MQNRLRGPADILIRRHPIARFFNIEGRLSKSSWRIAQKIPRRIHKSVHGVGFAARRTVALGTSDFGKELAFGERRTAFAGKWNVFREQYRQLTLRHRHRAAAIAIDNGYWRAPIALT